MASSPESRLPSLLLLAPPPQPVSRASLNAAYRPPLEGAISKLKDGAHGATLIVALCAPVLGGSSPRQRSLSWPDVQSLLAGLYSIISVICAKLSIPTQVGAGPGSVDARVVLVHHDLNSMLGGGSGFKPALEPNNTVVVDLATFLSAYHPFRFIFHPANEAGYKLLQTCQLGLETVQTLKHSQFIPVEGGLSLQANPVVPSQPTSPHSIVCLGGTFDHLHPGHKLLLTAAVLLLNVPERGATSKPCEFIIGITGDELLKRKKYAEFVQSWDERALNVIEFLASVLHLPKAGWKDSPGPKIIRKDGPEMVALFRDDTIAISCVVIQDAFGPTITTQAMDALVVSGETRSGGDMVNDKRKELGWNALEIFEVDVLDAEEIQDGTPKSDNFASKISSTAIRKQKAESRI